MHETPPEQHRSPIHTLFFSPGERRLRAGWRLLLHSFLLLVMGFCLAALVFSVLPAVDPYLLPLLEGIGPEAMLLAVFAEVLVVTASVFLARRLLDRRSIESLGLKISPRTLPDILAGFLITLLQMGLIFLLMSALGWIRFEGFAWQVDPAGLVITNVVVFFLVFLGVGWSEELLSRGYHLQTLASGLNLLWGVLISSAIFGILHLGNPNATWVSAAGIFLAGLLFAYGYLRTRQLWLPMGMHLGWNFFEGVVFGFPVSGLEIYPLTRIQVSGPELWTGGPFGPEAGLIVLPALALGTLLIYFYTRGRANTSPAEGEAITGRIR